MTKFRSDGGSAGGVYVCMRVMGWGGGGVGGLTVDYVTLSLRHEPFRHDFLKRKKSHTNIYFSYSI